MANWRFPIYHQGSVYEAGIYAVPFLVGLLAGADVEHKESIFSLLEELSTGGAWLDKHQGLPIGHDLSSPKARAKWSSSCSG